MEFETLYKKQKDFQEMIMSTYKISDKEKFIRDLIIHLNVETSEVLNEINWKMHRRELKTINRDKLLHEMVDVIKYALSLPSSYGFSAKEIENVFMEKSIIVEKKFQQEIINKDFSEADKLIGIDIDGVLADYVETFYKYVKRNLKVKIDYNYNEIKSLDLYKEFAKIFNVDEEKIKELKHKYRMSDEKKYMDFFEDSDRFIDALKGMGYRIILLSSRPINDYPNMFYNTIYSLNRNKINFDGIYFSEEKEKEILKRFSNIEFFVEDNYENALKISKLGKKVFLLKRSYNKKNKIPENIIPVEDYGQIIFKIGEKHDNNKESNIGIYK